MKTQNSTLETMGHGLPFYSAQAFCYSADYVSSFFDEHICAKNGLDQKTSAILATARHHWLLRKTRGSLNGKFSEGDIATCLDCFQGEIFDPWALESIASSLCDDLGIELDDYQNTPYAALIDSLQALSALECVLLADALEQTWYRGLPSGKGVQEFFQELGIELSGGIAK